MERSGDIQEGYAYVHPAGSFDFCSPGFHSSHELSSPQLVQMYQSSTMEKIQRLLSLKVDRRCEYVGAAVESY